MPRNSGGLTTESSNPSQARSLAYRGNAVGGVHVDEEVAGEEGHDLVSSFFMILMVGG